MSDTAGSFWRTHLLSTDRPLVHFVPADLLDLDSIKGAAGEIGFAFFLLNAREVDSEPTLMGVFAESMTLPSYFGRNWDALLDLTTDLSWKKAKGYVLTIDNAENLPSLPNRIFSSLVAVMEATVRDWRDERGEYSERAGPVCFHVIFSGGRFSKEALLCESPRASLRTHGQVLSEHLPSPVAV